MNKAVGWITGLLVTFVLSAVALHYYVPPLPAALDVTITFAEKNLTEGEPLAVTGEPGGGDFVYVKFLGGRSIAFGYDRWGSGGPLSAAITIRPGVPYALRIESPSLANVRGAPTHGPEKLRVMFDGTLVLEAPSRFDLRKASRAWLAENPIGGSSCGPRFSGELVSVSGHPLRGSARHAFTPLEKLGAWLTVGHWQVLGVLLASAALGWVAAQLARLRSEDVKDFFEQHRMGPHRWFVSAAAVCVVAFSWFITDGTGQLIYPEKFGDFFDFQASSLLQGRLDVPEPAISGEAFIVDGKYYGYFGVMPAVLRLPFAAYDVEFGELSRTLMLGYYIACLVAAYALLRHATRKLGGPDARPSAFATVLFTLGVGMGSTLFFLGSRAYIYHEAILCGAAFALWSAWCAVRWLDAPGSRFWLGALVCGVAAVHARPTSGLFALTLLGCVAIAVALAQKKFRQPFVVAALCTAGVASFSGVSWLKFKTLDGSPFKYSVQYSPERLARFEGKNFHLSNLSFGADTYFLRANFKLQRGFPWLIVYQPRREDYPRAKLDHLEHTLAIPFAMPALLALATAGSLLAAWHASALRRDLAVLWFSVGPMAVAMLTIVVVSHRYSTDFCPFLISTAACGLAALETLPSRWRGAMRITLALLTAAAIFVSTLLALWYQGEIVWGVPEQTKQNYRQLQHRADEFFLGAHH